MIARVVPLDEILACFKSIRIDCLDRGFPSIPKTKKQQKKSIVEIENEKNDRRLTLTRSSAHVLFETSAHIFTGLFVSD